MARIEIDESLLPIVVQRMPIEVTDPDIEEMIATLERFLARSNGRHAMVVDCTAGHRGLSARQRKRLAAWQKSLAERGTTLGVYTAVVVRSALVRAALTTFNWVSPPRRPRKPVATRKEAFDLCTAALEEEEIEIPEHVRRYRDALVRAPAAGVR